MSNGGGAREEIGANKFARAQFEELLSIYGQATAHKVGSMMEVKDFELSTCQKVPNSVMTCLLYANVYDLELYEDEDDYSGIRWTPWSKEPELEFKWANAKRGGPIRDDEGNLRPLITFKLHQLRKQHEEGDGP